jgi:hypothetical protein
VTRHVCNLSRGLLCPHFRDGFTGHYYSRIQSTACEQKRWGAVLGGLGPGEYLALARGERVVVHDVSEKLREPRAIWQGLPFIRYACRRAWGLETLPVRSRNGMDVTRYAEECYRGLASSARRELRYFRRYCVEGSRVDLSGCGARP